MGRLIKVSYCVQEERTAEFTVLFLEDFARQHDYPQLQELLAYARLHPGYPLSKDIRIRIALMLEINQDALGLEDFAERFEVAEERT